jgi:multidrug efflux pump subunit AcrA (membrane-fusion protein)
MHRDNLPLSMRPNQAPLLSSLAGRAAFMACLIAVIAAFGCNRQSPTSAAAGSAGDKKIAIVKIEKRTVTQQVDQPGTVQAFEETALLAKIPGYVGSVADDPDKKDRPPHDRQVDIGSRVKKEQVLAQLAIPELEQEWKQKKALVEQARAEVVQAEKSVVAAQAGVVLASEAVTEAAAGLERAQALYERWQLEVARVKKLISDGVDAKQTLVETEYQFKAVDAARKEANARITSAKAAVTKAEADRDKAIADVDAAKARLDVAREEVGRVDALRGYTRIKAPFDGVVTARSVNTGDYVTGNDKTPLFRVARMDPVRVVVKVPEADAGLAGVGQDVKITIQGLESAEQTGKVVRTSWALEQGSRTLRVEIDLQNKDGNVRPGMYVYARLTATLPAEWAVPAAAVGKINEQPVIYLVEGGKAIRVQVQLLRGDGQYTQVKRYRRAGDNNWTEVTGAESVATPAAGLSDGQTVP